MGLLGREWSSVPVGALVDLHLCVQIFSRRVDKASPSPFLSLSTAVFSSCSPQTLDSYRQSPNRCTSVVPPGEVDMAVVVPKYCVTQLAKGCSGSPVGTFLALVQLL